MCLLGPTALPGAPQQGSNAVPSLRAGLSASAKPTWHGGPPSTPPELETVPPPPAVPPPAKSFILGPQKVRNKPVSTSPGSVPSAGSIVPMKRVGDEPAPTANTNPHNYTDSPDPEALRIRDELNRLRDDSEARRTFYEDLRRTVERVRAGMRDEDSPERGTGVWPVDHGQELRTGAQNEDSPERDAAPSSRPAGSNPSHDTPGDPANPPTSSEEKPGKSERGPDAPQASLGTTAGSIDRDAYLRVLRWAKANGVPVPLALGVAWIESQLRTDPPRGAAGEVGMFQIMPARCKIEGWPPKRLKEPEFNAWLGTRLLARYYQEESSWARAAAKYVAGPGVFNKTYSTDVWNYINWYASSVNSYAGYFSRYQG